jgi:N-acetylneuraminic acid mutarotase
VLGGITDNAAVLASVLKFDSTQGTWSQIAPMSEARYGHAACAIGSAIYVLGGNSCRTAPQASVFKFDTEANEWSTMAPMPHDCSYHSGSVLDGLVYIVGAGCDVLCFDSASGVWATLAPTLVSRKYGVSFVLGGHLYAAGGAGSNSSVERYDVANDTWTAVASMLEGRSDFGAVTIGSAGPAEEQDVFDSLIIKASSERP